MTWVKTEAPETNVVLVLLSRENPIDEMGWEEQGLAVALRVNGAVTVAPFAGLVTVTAAKAGAHTIAAKPKGRKRAFMLQGLALSSENTWSSCLISLAGGTKRHVEPGRFSQLSIDLNRSANSGLFV